MIRARRALATVLVLLACSGVPAPPEVPEAEVRQHYVFGLLDPDSARQALIVEAVEAGGTLDDVRVRITASGDPSPLSELRQLDVVSGACIARYGVLIAANDLRCAEGGFRPAFGGRYDLVISSVGRDTARATVQVPGDFQLRSASAEGTPPGTRGLAAVWTPSAGAYRYLVTVSPSAADDCFNVHGCEDGWFTVTTDTQVVTTVPGSALHDRPGARWYVEVYAVDRGLFEYLTTGSGGSVFPVPPLQNVRGGHGAIGAWVRRSWALR